MTKLLIGLLAASASLLGQKALERQIATIAREAQGKVAVACLLAGTGLRCNLLPQSRPPMQSVFKLPLVVTVLHLIESGTLTLDQPIRFLKSDRILPKTYSPLQDKYPDADVDVPLRELAQSAVALSDNTAADILLRIVGGPATVNQYLAGLGIRGFHLRDGEAALHRDQRAQYRNWLQPSAAVAFLRLLNDQPPLHPPHIELLFQWMRESPTGAKRLKADLPSDTGVMHKTGTSGVTQGLAHATNDIGLIRLPDGRHLAIAVFVTDSRADEAVRESVIAGIAKVVYDAATRK